MATLVCAAMTTSTFRAGRPRFNPPDISQLPRFLLAPLPLIVVQPVLHRIVSHVARARPELFERLGPCATKRYLIDPTNLPFVMVLEPNPAQPVLRAYRRDADIAFDASIRGTFLTLLDMIDGQLDGDALFFTRDLKVDGDTEAIVSLRNAMDDLEGSIVDSVADAFQPLSKPAMAALAQLRKLRKEGSDDAR